MLNHDKKDVTIFLFFVSWFLSTFHFIWCIITTVVYKIRETRTKLWRDRDGCSGIVAGEKKELAETG